MAGVRPSGPAATNAYDDLNGNRLTKEVPGTSDDTDYFYDVSDRLIAAEVDGDEVFTATCDAGTRRLSKTEGGVATLFRYDGGTSFQELTPGGEGDVATDNLIATELIRAGGLGGGIGSVLHSDRSMAPTSGPVEHVVYNAVGHTVALTNGGSSLTQTSLYEAFGDRVLSTGTSTNNRLANTKERDASINLDNHGFRYYDPETGRYVTRDPIGYGDGMNVYASVRNNPINGVDPLGLTSTSYRAGNRSYLQAVETEDGIRYKIGYEVDRIQTNSRAKSTRSGTGRVMWSLNSYSADELNPEAFEKAKASVDNHFQIARDLKRTQRIVQQLEFARDLVPYAKAADLAILQGDYEGAMKAAGEDTLILATGAVAGKTLQTARAARLMKNGASSMDEVAMLGQKNARLVAGTAAGGQATGVTASKLAGDTAADAVALQQAGIREATFVTVGGVRKIDVLELTGRIIANEVKTGRTALTADVRRELARDWWLRRQGQVDQVNWIFSQARIDSQ